MATIMSYMYMYFYPVSTSAAKRHKSDKGRHLSYSTGHNKSHVPS